MSKPTEQKTEAASNLEKPAANQTIQKLETQVSVLLKDESWQEMREKVNLTVRSGLLPANVDFPKALIIAAYGKELGLSPIIALKEVYVVDGKASMSSALMKGCVHQKLPKALFKVTESSADKCVIVTKRDKDDANEPLATWTFTMEEAKAFYSGSKGIKDNWRKFPADMLRARCISRACRGEFSDVFLGAIYDHEELEELRETVAKRTKSEIQLNKFNEEMKTLAKGASDVVVVQE
jgi:hypothetical protein